MSESSADGVRPTTAGGVSGASNSQGASSIAQRIRDTLTGATRAQRAEKETDGIDTNEESRTGAHNDASGLVSGGIEEGPNHIAIIMDGNHRWAKRRHLPGAAGHRAGAKNVKTVTKACADQGVSYLTLFAFSTENWQRPSLEVNLLIDLMRSVLEDDVDELHANGIKLSIIGDRTAFASDLQMLMKRAEAMTRQNRRMTLSIAINYGGRWDIAQAARKLAEEVAAGRLDSNQVDEQALEQHMSLAGLPGPDLCVRTGGDRRISNFLLWDFAYTELYFTESYWPDFDQQELALAISDYVTRQRRFGKR